MYIDGYIVINALRLALIFLFPVFILLIIIYIAITRRIRIPRIRQESKPRKTETEIAESMERKEKKVERKEKRFIEYTTIKYPSIKDVYVFEKHADLIIPVRAKYDMSTQLLITEDNKTYVVPDSYRPLLFYRKKWFKRQALLVFLADPSSGTLLKWDSNGISHAAINPKFIGTVLNSKILEKLAGAVFVRVSDIIAWLLAGLGVAFILVFVIFPLLGIHVSIGTQPVIVQPQVNIHQPTSTAPPPGNFTIGTIGGGG